MLHYSYLTHYPCTVYDLEPQKLTGVVKYVGKVDSEFLDNRIYVGVRLDEPGVWCVIVWCLLCVECLHNC